MVHAAIHGPDNPRRMLPLELLRDVLWPRHRRAPHDDDGRFLRRASAILDANCALHVVIIAPEAKRLRDAKPEAVFPHEGDLTAPRHLGHVQRLARDGEVHDERSLPGAFHGDAPRSEQARHDHGLDPAIVEIPGGEVATVARHLRLVQRSCHLHRLQGHGGHGYRHGSRRSRGGCPRAWRGRGGGLCRWRLGLLGGRGSLGSMCEERLVENQEARHQQGGNYGSFLHQARGSIKIDAPLLGVAKDQVADRTRRGGTGGSARASARPASHRGQARAGGAPSARIPSSSARSDRRPAEAASEAIDIHVSTLRRSAPLRSRGSAPARHRECSRHVRPQLVQRSLQGPRPSDEHGVHAP
jgi:hypothetical protein